MTGMHATGTLAEVSRSVMPFWYQCIDIRKCRIEYGRHRLPIPYRYRYPELKFLHAGARQACVYLQVDGQVGVAVAGGHC